jgi:allantoicase
MDFRRYPDLASSLLGGRAVHANDAFFAPVESLVDPATAVFDPDRYTDRGKWMDGWETRRRREPGNDWAVVRLGVPGVVRGVVVDTRHFKGNHPESASVEATVVAHEPPAWEEAAWTPLVPRSPLAPDAENAFAVDDPRAWTHVRLSIYPDGGVARLRVHGEAAPDWEQVSGPVDLASVTLGGRIADASDAFFSDPAHLLLPGRSTGMHDGWETRRRRGPGHDWVIVRLGHRGRIERVEIETHHFKGNYPESAALDLADLGERPERSGRGGSAEDQIPTDSAWREVLPRTKLGPDAAHAFDAEAPAATHARLRIYPDGGVARLRIYGEPLR